jgi:hypothetical protein
MGVVSFTARPLYSQGKRPRYLLDRRLSGPQRRYERCGISKSIHAKLLREPWMIKELEKAGGKLWIGFIWLRIGTIGGLL